MLKFKFCLRKNIQNYCFQGKTRLFTINLLQMLL